MTFPWPTHPGLPLAVFEPANRRSRAVRAGVVAALGKGAGGLPDVGHVPLALVMAARACSLALSGVLPSGDIKMKS